MTGGGPTWQLDVRRVCDLYTNHLRCYKLSGKYLNESEYELASVNLPHIWGFLSVFESSHLAFQESTSPWAMRKWRHLAIWDAKNNAMMVHGSDHFIPQNVWLPHSWNSSPNKRSVWERIAIFELNVCGVQGTAISEDDVVKLKIFSWNELMEDNHGLLDRFLKIGVIFQPD